jgi:small subunit ribosomal protein S16
MVRIRLARFGKRNRPFYRLGIFDARTRRNGRCIEYVGTYDPFGKTPETTLKLDLERIRYWVSQGAQPSENAGNLMKKAGFPWPPEKKKSRKRASKKPKKKAGK